MATTLSSSSTSCDVNMDVSNISSLYIPHINNVDEKYIIRAFQAMLIGNVSRVDFVINRVKQRREAFVHFAQWYDTDESMKLRKDIINPNTQTRFIHRANNYWPLLINKNPTTCPKSNATYDIEERIEAIQNQIASLGFMANVHDANIRFLMKRTNDLQTGNQMGNLLGNQYGYQDIKRQRLANVEACDTSHTCHNMSDAWQPSQPGYSYS